MQENKKSPEALNFKNLFGPSCNLEVASSNQLGTTELEEYLLQRSVMTSSDILWWVKTSVTSKKSPNVNKSCPKMISLEKIKDFHTFTKIA